MEGGLQGDLPYATPYALGRCCQGGVMSVEK